MTRSPSDEKRATAASSTPGAGSEFVFTLPLIQSKDEESLGKPVSAETSGSNHEK